MPRLLVRPVVSSRGRGCHVSGCCSQCCYGCGPDSPVANADRLFVSSTAREHLRRGGDSVRCFVHDSGVSTQRQSTWPRRVCDNGVPVPILGADNGLLPRVPKCGRVHACYALQLPASQVDESRLQHRALVGLLGADHSTLGRILGVLSTKQVH